MTVIPLLQKEFGREAKITRKFLKLVPVDKFDWKPHEKSMPMKQLSVHIAELPSWVEMALTTEELDFAQNDYEPTPVSTSDELLNLFEESVKKGEQALNNAEEEDLLPDWTCVRVTMLYK